ncbi:hypothetical protein Ade02nite_59140 [Paractinoplanes deccanensis]|uniref:DUF402 domain-containing protein n=1 Tax=Paractinoplanes deccanensis TaxID=113561 RepID=A0ABQ3YB77_9ACTN|nr:DUF402 domain-containing protein [Actinoplanes deccanensis]GID77273.1 hypothetical protein Ade02nite_59140 [Actinoplanes deccanensis]
MDSVLLRYRYHDGAPQAAFPMRVVEDDGERVVAWLAPETEIMYWALPDGGDPRSLPLEARFSAPLTTARRRWQGGGVLRVVPLGAPFQVVHFWEANGDFAGWYVNLEAPKRRAGDRIDSVDWHLDLWISPDREPTWKDIDEAEAALAAGHLTPGELALAWRQGNDIIDGLAGWPALVGDWRSFAPPVEWGPLALPPDWAS